MAHHMITCQSLPDGGFVAHVSVADSIRAVEAPDMAALRVAVFDLVQQAGEVADAEFDFRHVNHPHAVGRAVRVHPISGTATGPTARVGSSNRQRRATPAPPPMCGAEHGAAPPDRQPHEARGIDSSWPGTGLTGRRRRRHASIVCACVRQKSRHDGPLRRGAGSRPARRRMFPDRRRSHPMTQLEKFAMDTAMTPRRILPGHAYSQLPDDGGDAGTTSQRSSVAGVTILTRHNSRGRNRVNAANSSRSFGSNRGPAHLSSQYRYFMTQDQQLDVLRRLTTAGKHRQTKERPQSRIHGREDHPPMMPNAGQRLGPKLLSPTRQLHVKGLAGMKRISCK